MRKLLLGGLIYGLTALSHAQPGIQWQRTYGGSGNEQAFHIVNAEAGGYFIVGQTTSSDGDVSTLGGGTDIWVLRLNDGGDLLWEQCLGGSDNDRGRELISTVDGGCVVLGYTSSMDGDVGQSLGGDDIWAIKLNEVGEVEWEQSYGGSEGDVGLSIQPAADDGYFLFGFSQSPEIPGWHAPAGDYYLAHIAATGELIEQRCYGGSGTEAGYGMRVSPAGEVIMSGASSSTDGDVIGNSSSNVWVVSVDQDMNIVWQRILSDNGAPGNSIVGVHEQEIYIGGSTIATEGETIQVWGGRDIFVAKLDGSGPLSGSSSFGGSDDEAAWSLVSNGSSGLYSIGSTRSTDGHITDPRGGQDAWVLSLNDGLDLNWQKTFGGSADESFFSGCIAPDGGLVLVGYSNSIDGDLTNNQGGRDLWVVKLDPEGVSVPEQPGSFTLTIAPNPANVLLRITWSSATVASLTVHDALGQIVHSQNVCAAMGQLNLPVDAWASGIYTISLQDAAGRHTERFVKE